MYRYLKTDFDYTDSSLFEIAEKLLVFYIIYNTALVEIGFFIPRLSIVLLAICVFCVFIEDKYVINLTISKGYYYLFFFAAISSITGVLFGNNRSLVITQVAFLIRSLILGYLIIRITIYKRNESFIAIALCVSGMILSLYMIVSGGEAYVSNRYSISEGMNVNTLAVLIMFSIWALSRICEEKRNLVISLLLMIIGTSLSLYVVMLTASRKGMIGLLFIVLFWLVRCFLPMIKRNSPVISLLAIFAGLALVLYILYRYRDAFILRSSTLFERMDEFADGDGDWLIRWDMIKDAIQVGITHPIFGVGLNNYRLYSAFGSYSHNTYAEAFACTGIFGTLPLFSSFAYCGIIIMKDRSTLRYNMLYMLLYFLFLYTCISQISFYNNNLMLILYILLAYCTLKEQQSAEIVTIGSDDKRRVYSYLK